MTKTILRKTIEMVVSDLIVISSGKNVEEINKNLGEYYDKIEQIRGYKITKGQKNERKCKCEN